LLTDADLCRRIGTAAKVKVHEHYSAEVAARSFEPLYEDLIARSRREARLVSATRA
jgi:hypothetical protein